MKGYLVLLALSVILASGCTGYYHAGAEDSASAAALALEGECRVDIGGESITAEIAGNAEERQRGLMFREGICRDCGMLFVFESEGFHGFWMKNTLIPLDMIFIDADFNVIDVLHAVPCEEEPCRSYAPDKKALYVLETNAGRFDEGIIGKKAEITAV